MTMAAHLVARAARVPEGWSQLGQRNPGDPDIAELIDQGVNCRSERCRGRLNAGPAQLRLKSRRVCLSLPVNLLSISQDTTRHPTSLRCVKRNLNIAGVQLACFM